MSDDSLSFFDDPEFKFAKETANVKDSRNRINCAFFASKVMEDDELTGYVYLDVPVSLRAGSVFIRLETTEETHLEKRHGNEPLADRLKLLREKVKADGTIADQPHAKPTMNRGNSPGKKNMVIPLSLGTLQRAYDPIMLRRESSSSEMVRSSYTRCILDAEAFVFDYEVSKNTVLVLPFRIALRGKLNRSCNLSLDNTTYVASGRKKIVNTVKKQLTDGKIELLARKVYNTGLNDENRQYIKISHRFIVYYATKNDVHNFNQVQQSLSDEERNKIRYEAMQKSDYFLDASKEFKVMPNFKQVNYKKHNRRSDASVEQDHPYFLCCTKKVKLAVNICLDLINLRDRDTSLNFVMNFNRQIIEDYLYLDVIIYSRLTYTGDEPEDTSFMENVCMVQSFDLDRKLPSNSPFKLVEYVQKLDLTPIQGKYQSVSSEHVKVEYFIKFYLSSLALRLNLEVLEIPLNFLRLGEEFRSQDPDEIAFKFEKVEDRIKRSKIGVMLPYAIVDFDKNVRGNGFAVEEPPEDDDRLLDDL